MQAIAMVAQILQRHVHAMQNSSTGPVLAIDSAPEHAAAELPGPHQLVENESMRQDIMRALFAEPTERCVSPQPLPSGTPATPLLVLPTSLVRPDLPAKLFGVRTDAAHSRRRLRPRRRPSCASRAVAAACLRPRLLTRSSSRPCSRRRSAETK